MAGCGKVLFDLGLLVCLWVEVSSRPEGPTPAVMPAAYKLDSDSSSVIDTFADTQPLADTLRFVSQGAIYVTADASDDIDLDSSRAVDTSNGRETSADSTITIDSVTATDTPVEDLHPDSSIAIDSSTDTHVDLPHPVPTIAIHTFSEAKDMSDDFGPSVASVMGQNEIRNILIEDFKKRVLDGLKLANAPTETLNGTELSNDLIEVLQQENEVTRSDQKENIVVHASNSKHIFLLYLNF